MKIFSGIFKRTYRSLKDEFKKLYRLNQLYLEDESTYDSDLGEFNIFASDYTGPATDVRPAADPHIVSDSQRMAQAQAMLQLATTTPGVSVRQAQLMFAKAWKVSEIEQLLPDPKGPNAIPPKIDPKVQIEQMRLKDRQEDRQINTKLAGLKLMDAAKVNEAKIKKMEAEAVRALEEAGGVQTGHAIAALNAEIAMAKAKQDGLMSAIEMVMKMSEGPEDKEPSEG